jgi:chromosomal replication initiator protein
MNEDQKNQIWQDCLGNIKISVSPAIFSTWFSQTHISNIISKDDRLAVEIGCPSSFIKNTIENRYYGLIQDTLNKVTGKNCDVIFEVKTIKQKESQNINTTPLFQTKENKDEDESFIEEIKRSRLRPFYTFENFAVSSSNQMAWAASEAVAKNIGTAYNPLFLWGGVGVGKTHLMNAVGYFVKKKDINKNVYFCTGEDFTNDIVEGIRNKTTQKFRNKYRKLDVLLIDDIQFIAGKDAVQEEFFHTFNTIVAAGGQIILTSDRPPSEISKLEERLRSRFEAGLIVDIAPPDFELRCAITQIKAKEKNIPLDMSVVQIIAGNLDSARKIEGFLIRLKSAMEINKYTQINEEIVENLLGKRSEEIEKRKRVSSDEVIEAVCKQYSIKKKQILSNSRVKNFALPRQVLMYLLRTELDLPLQEVGRLIGGRDHTTVMHAVEKITKLASESVDIREDISGIKKILWG